MTDGGCPKADFGFENKYSGKQSMSQDGPLHFRSTTIGHRTTADTSSLISFAIITSLRNGKIVSCQVIILPTSMFRIKQRYPVIKPFMQKMYRFFYLQ
jgi:hypothetical protein